jgi:hypothetical protein
LPADLLRRARASLAGRCGLPCEEALARLREAGALDQRGRRVALLPIGAAMATARTTIRATRLLADALARGFPAERGRGAAASIVLAALAASRAREIPRFRAPLDVYSCVERSGASIRGAIGALQEDDAVRTVLLVERLVKGEETSSLCITDGELQRTIASLRRHLLALARLSLGEMKVAALSLFRALLPGTLLPGTLLPETLLPETLLPGTLLPGTLLPEKLPSGTLSSRNAASRNAASREAAPADKSGVVPATRRR